MIGYCDQAQGSNRDVLPALPRQSAATTGTSTSRRAATTTGVAGSVSWPRCRANWSPPSSSRSRESAAPGAAPGSRYLGGVQHAEERSSGRGRQRRCWCAGPRGRVLTGAAVDRRLMATIGMPTSETAPAHGQAGAQRAGHRRSRTGTPNGADRDRRSSAVPRRAGRRRREAVERPARAEHRVLCLPGARGQAERSGGVGLRAAPGAQRRAQRARVVDGADAGPTSTPRPPTTFASRPNDSASRRTWHQDQERPIAGNATASSRSSQPGRWRSSWC